MFKQLERYIKRLDVVGGIVGSVVGAAIAGVAYITGEQGTLEIGVAVLSASVIYILFRNKIANSAKPSLPENKSLTIILNTVFVSSFSASILIMQSSPHRPPSYFILTAVAVAAIASEIISANEESKSQTGLILLKILLVAFSLRYGLLYEFPGFYGVDPWWHAEWVEEWLSLGRLDPYLSTGYASYAEFPIMHLNIMAMRLITQLDPKASFFWGIGLFYIVSILFVFLLGRRLVNTRTGILAALFLSFNLHHISFGALLTPTSFGVAISAMILWLIQKDNYGVHHAAILILVSIVLVFTHTVSAFVMAIMLLLLTVGNGIAQGALGSFREKFNIGFNMLILFWVLMLMKWMYNFYFPSASFFDTVLGWFVRAVETDVQYVGTAFQAAEFETAWLNRMEFMMLIGFIVIGILFWVSPKEMNSKKVAIVTAVLGLSIVAFGFPYIGIINLIPGRWIPFIVVVAAPIVAEGILVLSRLLNGERKKAVFLVSIVFVFALFTINSQGVNTYTPFYGLEYIKNPDRFAFKDGELTAVDSILAVHPSRFTTDVTYLALPFHGRTEPGTTEILTTERPPDGLVVVRKYIYTHLNIIGSDEDGFNRLLNSLTSSEYNTVYDNGEVKAYSSH